MSDLIDPALVKHPENVYPLEQLPQDMQDDIAWAVAQPKPPPRWLDLGLAQIPSRAWSEWYWQRGRHQHRSRPAIPGWLRQRVFERDGHKCLACGATEALSLDHIHHFSKGGSDTIENLRTLCRSCNSKRRTRTDEEWLGAPL